MQVTSSAAQGVGIRWLTPSDPHSVSCRVMPMAVQFSVLIMLHSALVLITTAEDYKCLPLILRKTCCWINETYLARNVIIFASILINFLGAVLNIVSIPNPPALWYVVRSQEVRAMEPAASCIAFLDTCHSHVPGPAPSLGTENRNVATVTTVHFTVGKLPFSRGEIICSKGAQMP